MTTKEKVLAFYGQHPSLEHVPFVGNFLTDLGRTRTDVAARTRVEYWLGPYLAAKRLKTWHRVAPRKYSGGLLVSVLGWQVIRILFHNAKWRIARAISPQPAEAARTIVQQLDERGVIVLDNIFSPAEVAELQRDFREKIPSFVAHWPEFLEGYLIPTNSMPPRMKFLGSPTAQKLIVDNEKLKAIIETVSGHTIRLCPEVSYLEYKQKLDQLGKPQVDGQDVLHSDVNYPSFKIFVYLEDTDETNGAFRFCPGTHRLTLKRLWVEYFMGIRYYWLTRTGYYKPLELSPKDRELLKLNGAEVPQCGKAGSVIIFNTMGFHRRGDFTDANKPYRHVVLSNYRHLDTIANALGLVAK